MTSSSTSRRQFLQATAGGLIVSAALTSPDTKAAQSDGSARVANPVSGDVLRTKAGLAADGKTLIELQRAIPLVGKSDVLVCGGGPAGIGIGIAGWFLSRVIRKRVAKRLDPSTQPPPENKPKGYRDYAQQQADLYTATGGRDALKDQTAGRIYDQEVEKMLSGENAELFYALRDRVNQNVNRIFTKNAQRTTSF